MSRKGCETEVRIVIFGHLCNNGEMPFAELYVKDTQSGTGMVL